MSGTFYPGSSKVSTKSKFKSTNLNSAVSRAPIRAHTSSAGLYVVEVKKNRVTRVPTGLGVTAVPTPVNTPSLSKESKSKDAQSSTYAPSDQVGGKLWGQVVDQPSSSKVESNGSSATPGVRQNAWGTLNKSNNSTDAADGVASKAAIVMPSWADAESDEDDEEEPVRAPPPQYTSPRLHQPPVENWTRGDSRLQGPSTRLEPSRVPMSAPMSSAYDAHQRPRVPAMPDTQQQREQQMLEEARREREELERRRRQQAALAAAAAHHEAPAPSPANEARWERVKPTIPLAPPPRYTPHIEPPGFTRQQQRDPPVAFARPPEDRQRVTEPPSMASSLQDPSKPFSSLFVVPPEEETDLPPSKPIEILRNLDLSSKKMLYDPKKGILVESSALATAPPSGPAAVGVEKKPRPVKAPAAEESASWKHETQEKATFQLKRRQVTESSEGLHAQSKAHHEVVVDPAVEKLKADRDEERRARGPRTKGVLYVFTAEGTIEQVLSAAERAEAEAKAAAEAEKRLAAEALKRERDMKKSERAEKKSKKETVSGKWKKASLGEEAVEAPAESAPVSMEAAVATKAVKPAWQARGQTLVDIGIAVKDPSALSPDDPVLENTHKPRGDKKKSRKALAAAVTTTPVRDPFSSEPSDLDTINLDIRNQGSSHRDPASYGTFIPGAGLTSSPNNDLDCPPFELNPLDIATYDLSTLGISDSQGATSWNGHSWPTLVPNAFDFLTEDDLHGSNAALSSVAFALGADEILPGDVENTLPHSPPVEPNTSPNWAPRGGRGGRGRGRNPALPPKHPRPRGPPRVANSVHTDAPPVTETTNVDPLASSRATRTSVKRGGRGMGGRVVGGRVVISGRGAGRGRGRQQPAEGAEA